MSAKRTATNPDWADPDDAPELTDSFFEAADEYQGDTLIRRGRPRTGTTKVALTVRYDADIVAAFRATGTGWQTRMNEVLRAYVAAHKRG